LEGGTGLEKRSRKVVLKKNEINNGNVYKETPTVLDYTKAISSFV
jgi:hypothetical protein